MPRPVDTSTRGLPHTAKSYPAGCRCDDCRSAHNAARREYVQRTKPARRLRGLEPGDPRHGTLSGYSYHQCRCQECRGAMRVYQDGRDARRSLKLQEFDARMALEPDIETQFGDLVGE